MVRMVSSDPPKIRPNFGTNPLAQQRRLEERLFPLNLSEFSLLPETGRWSCRWRCLRVRGGYGEEGCRVGSRWVVEGGGWVECGREGT